MKKTNKIIAIFLVVVMITALAAVSAFAGYVAADDGECVDAVVTKRVETPKGTSFEGGTFTFTFVQKDEDDAYAVESDAANIGTRSVTIAAGNKVNGNDENDIYVNVARLFDAPTSVKGTTAQKPFPHAGVYKYTVTETAGYNETLNSDSVNYHNSDAEYTVYVVVANTKDKTDLFVKSVIVVKTKNDDGSAVSGDQTATKDKVENGEGSDTTGEGEDEENIGSNFAFTNTYVKTNNTDPNGGEDPEDPTADDNDAKTLYVQKLLVDENNVADPNAEYTFTVKVKIPSLATDATYGAYVVDTAATDPTAPVSGKTASFARGAETSQTITLKANERLVFEKLPIGAIYTVAETDPGDKYTVATVSSGTVTSDGLGVQATTITGEGNYVRTTNTVDESTTTPEGILINNLPYIILAILAIGGLTAYVMIRRKENEA